MKYVIRKVPERNTKYLERLLPEALIFNDVNHKGAIWSFFEAIKMADDDACYLQDDVLLCKDFKKRFEAIQSAHKDEVIILTTLGMGKNKDPYPLDKGEGYYTGRKAGWVVGIYIPKKIAKEWVDFHCSGGYALIGGIQRKLKLQHDDTYFNRWFDNFTNYKMYALKPSLVGHRIDIPSSVMVSRGVRYSPYFDYENCEPMLEGEK